MTPAGLCLDGQSHCSFHIRYYIFLSPLSRPGQTASCTVAMVYIFRIFTCIQNTSWFSKQRLGVPALPAAPPSASDRAIARPCPTTSILATIRFPTSDLVATLETPVVGNCA